jgi:hypothetical protein
MFLERALHRDMTVVDCVRVHENVCLFCRVYDAQHDKMNDKCGGRLKYVA